jgi:ribose transport system substrate-binding protein
MKKKSWVILGLLLLAATAAFARGQDAGRSAAGTYRIGYSNMALREDFFITVEGGIRQACKAAGYTYDTAIADRDAAKMKQNIEALLTKGADIIIDFNVLPEAGSAIASDLKAKNIPLLSIDCIYEGAYFFGVNNLEAGRILGEAAIPFVDQKFGGKIEYIVNLFDIAGGDEVKKRNDGVVEVLQKKYNIANDNVIWINSAADDVKTQTMTRDWLNSHPAATKIVFIGQNDDRGFAINAAVEGDNRVAHSIVVSHNADPSSVENLMRHVKDNNTAWVATASYNSHLYGEQIINMATRILKGEAVKQSEYTQVTIVTTKNVESYVAERDRILASLK